MAAVKDRTAGWVQVESHDRLPIGAKTYRNMVVWQRACSVCGDAFTIPLRAGDVTNNSFGYRTCKAHRGMKPGDATPSEELTELKAELKAAYEVSMDHMQEKGNAIRALAALRVDYDIAMAKLAKYELQPALESISKKFPWGS